MASEMTIGAYEPDFEARVENMRRAVLALYTSDPSAETARLLVMMETTIERRREEVRRRKASERSGGDGE